MRPYRSYSPDNGELVSVDVSEQCDAMLTNLETLLTEQGAKVQLDAVVTVGSPG